MLSRRRCRRSARSARSCGRPRRGSRSADPGRGTRGSKGRGERPFSPGKNPRAFRLAGRPGGRAGVDLPFRALVCQLDLTALPAALERDLRVVVLVLVERDLVVAVLEELVPVVIDALQVTFGIALDDARRPGGLRLHPRNR